MRHPGLFGSQAHAGPRGVDVSKIREGWSSRSIITSHAQLPLVLAADAYKMASGFRRKAVLGGADWLYGAVDPMKFPASDQRVLFLLVGAFNTLLGVAVFAVLVTALGPGVPAVVSVVLTWLMMLCIAFCLHRRWVFRVKSHAWLDFARFTLANVAFLFVNLATIALLVDRMRMPAIPVQLGLIIVVIVFSYLAHKHFSFSRGAYGAGKDGEQ